MNRVDFGCDASAARASDHSRTRAEMLRALRVLEAAFEEMFDVRSEERRGDPNAPRHKELSITVNTIDKQETRSPGHPLGLFVARPIEGVTRIARKGRPASSRLGG